MFCQIGKALKKTNADKLNQNTKFKTGYDKTPYFLCLLSINHRGINQNDKRD